MKSKKLLLMGAFICFVILTAKSQNSTWLTSQTSWLDTTQDNTIISPQKLLDNNTATKGYLSMSNYSTIYTKEMYLNFGQAMIIDGFSFTYDFPNCKQGACSSYPTDIVYTCQGNLYYKDSSNQWINAYICPNLNAKDNSMVCPMSDSASFTFTAIKAQEWKFEMIGNYWLGDGYQTTTYYDVKDIHFHGLPSNVDLVSGLIAYYPFNGNANDESGNANNGTVSGATLTTDRFGHANSAYSFNGSGYQWIDCGANQAFALNTNMTISAWVIINQYSADNNVGYIIASNYDGVSKGFIFNICGPDKGNLSFRWNDGGNEVLVGPTNLNLNTWYHCLITYDGMNMKLYLNGNFEKTQQYSNPLGNIHFIIGGSGNIWYAPVFDMNGKIDDVRLYDRVLDSTEIKTLSNEKIVQTGFNSNAFQDLMNVFPNPASDHISIDFGSNYNSVIGYTLRITNILGQVVYSTNVYKQMEYIDFNKSMDKGIYLLHLINRNDRMLDVKKIVIQ
jgi:Concanavalin A-like lectin/glucanases superfamily/Secretion system C-terminal sorting domain